MRTAMTLSLLLACGTAYAAPVKAPAPKSAPKQVNSEEQLFRQLKQAQNAEDAHVIEKKHKLMSRPPRSPSVDVLMTGGRCRGGFRQEDGEKTGRGDHQ